MNGMGLKKLDVFKKNLANDPHDSNISDVEAFHFLDILRQSCYASRNDVV